MLTERLRPHGAPIAMTKSPSVRVADWPRAACGRGLVPFGISSLSKATSVSLSEPRILALYAWPSYNRHRTSVALSTTCQFESTSPSALMRTPLPEVSWLRFSPRCRSSVRHLMNTTAGNTRSFPFFTTSRKSRPSSALPAPPWAPARGSMERPAAISRIAPQQDRIMRPPCGRTPKFQARSLARIRPRRLRVQSTKSAGLVLSHEGGILPGRVARPGAGLPASSRVGGGMVEMGCHRVGVREAVDKGPLSSAPGPGVPEGQPHVSPGQRPGVPAHPNVIRPERAAQPRHQDVNPGWVRPGSKPGIPGWIPSARLDPGVLLAVALLEPAENVEQPRQSPRRGSPGALHGRLAGNSEVSPRMRTEPPAAQEGPPNYRRAWRRHKPTPTRHSPATAAY